MTVNRRARDGTIPFHDRACVIGEAGISSSAGFPWPKTSKAIRTPSR